MIRQKRPPPEIFFRLLRVREEATLAEEEGVHVRPGGMMRMDPYELIRTAPRGYHKPSKWVPFTLSKSIQEGTCFVYFNGRCVEKKGSPAGSHSRGQKETGIGNVLCSHDDGIGAKNPQILGRRGWGKVQD